MQANFNSIDEYLASFPEATQTLLKQLREAINSAAPNATERISYGMACYRGHQNLIHFAGYKNHVGFYPGVSAVVHFKSELAEFITGKNTIRLGLDQELPLQLILEIVRFRVAQDEQKHLHRKRK